MAALIRTNMVSDAVKDRMDVLLAVPQKKHVRSAKSPELRLGSFQNEYPVLFLLHDEASSPGELFIRWRRFPALLMKQGFLIVLPQGLLSFLLTMQKGTSMKGRRKTAAQYRRAVQRNAIWVLSSGHSEFCLQHLSSIKKRKRKDLYRRHRHGHLEP